MYLRTTAFMEMCHLYMRLIESISLLTQSQASRIDSAAKSMLPPALYDSLVRVFRLSFDGGGEHRERKPRPCKTSIVTFPSG